MMNNKIVGITCSTFDLLHTGHIIMLEECKKHCDYLICALQNDPTIDRKDKNKPIQSLVERYLQLDAVKYVDKIIPYNDEEELEELFSSLGLDYLKYIVVDEKHFRPEELENLKGDSTKLRKELSWEPEYTFESMLDEMINYWLEYYEKK